MGYSTSFAELGVAALVVCVAGCASTTDETQTLLSIVITPPADTLAVGETLVITGSVRTAAGETVAAPVDWSSSDPDVVTVGTEQFHLEDTPGIRITAGTVNLS